MAEAPVVVTREIDEEAGLWQLDAYMDDKPGAALLALLRSLVPSAKGKKPVVEQLPDEDWVTLSQQGLEPVRAGRFFVHTSSRSEEHTSELQSLMRITYAVFCLTKKTIQNTRKTT